MRNSSVMVLLVLGACGTDGSSPRLPPAGVVFTYPRDQQLDVPTGARLLVSFSDAKTASSAGTLDLVGPEGPVQTTITMVGNGRTMAIDPQSALDPGTSYSIGEGESSPILKFTTRNNRPLSGPPKLIGINGSELPIRPPKSEV